MYASISNPSHTPHNKIRNILILCNPFSGNGQGEQNANQHAEIIKSKLSK
jgi:hypothetical protein